MYDRWNVRGYDRGEAVRLCRRGLNPMVAVLLASRGITDADALSDWLRDDLSALSDPLSFQDMDRARDRVRQALERGEHVAVYGDYDVDGITASCLVADYLRGRGLVCDIYIPQRLEEGYGVKAAALDTIKGWGCTLVITVDCGITALEEAAYAAGIGLDLVITDHHRCGETVPAALAAVDPMRPDCRSASKNLAGVGVAFKLICAVEGPGSEEKLLDRYGDLVAAGTVADVMPVTGENRVLIKRGLQRMYRGERPGFLELRAASGLDNRPPTVSNVGFAIAPRVNAAGRLGSTATAVELLLTRDRRRASVLADELCALNRERQRIESGMFHEALAMLESFPDRTKPIVLASDTWHQGVCGIVASRISEKFNVPAVMISVKDGVGRGSCRSVEGFNLYDALSRCRDVLLGFGGHEMAAGLTVSRENIGALREALGKLYEGAAAPERVLNVDFEVIKPELLSLANVEALDSMEPYGAGNPTPVLCMRDAVVENVAALSEGRHTKLWLRKGGAVFEALFFSRRPEELGVRAGDRVDAAFTPQINEFRGRRTVQLSLDDIRP